MSDANRQGEQWVRMSNGRAPSGPMLPALLAEDLDTDAETAQVTLANDPEFTDTLTVDNTFMGCGGQQGDRCLLLAVAGSWQEQEEPLPYSVVLVKKHVLTIPIEIAYDPATGILAGKTQDVLVETSGDVSDWQNIFQGVEDSSEEPGASTSCALELGDGGLFDFGGGGGTSYGQEVTFTVTVTDTSGSGATPSGAIVFLDGTQPIGTATMAGGVALFSTTRLSGGDHHITAQYQGDLYFASSTSASVDVSVDKADPVVTLSASAPDGIAYGDGIYFYVTLAAGEDGDADLPPSGDVQLWDGDETMVAQFAVNGSGSYNFALPAGGEHSFTAYFIGSDNYNDGESEACTGSVDKKDLTVVAQNFTRTKGGGNPTFTVQYEGIVGDHSEITGTAEFDCDATPDSPAIKRCKWRGM